MALEVELKFLLSNEDAARLASLPPVVRRSQGGPVAKRLVSTYYDTPDLALKSQKVAYRIREVGSDWIQTVKGKGVVREGVVTREEIEHPLETDRPDFSKLDGTAFEALFADGSLRDALQPVFVTDFNRTAWRLRDEHGEIEMALDQGGIRAGERHVPLLELELELIEGVEADILRLADELAAHLPLERSTINKAQRGYNLLSP